MPVWILGIPAAAVVIQRLLQATNGVIEHANVRVWAPLDRMLSLVWVTPNVHKIHHSRVIHETNSNYANLLTLYERLLGTYTPAERADAVVYGLDDVDPVTASLGILAEERQQRLQVDAAALVYVSADRLVLRDAITNVIDNAIKYSPLGSLIRESQASAEHLTRSTLVYPIEAIESPGPVLSGNPGPLVRY